MFEMFQYPFMREAIMCGLLIATLCALQSSYIHYKSQAMMSDGISHAMLLGITFAALIKIPLILGGILAALGCVALTQFIRNHSQITADAALGISYTTLFALGLLLYQHSGEQHLTHILFGNLLGIPQTAQLRIILTAAFILPLLVLFQRPLALMLYDPIQARLSGIAIKWLEYLMLIALALTTTVAIEAVGIILTVAMLISPALTARLISRHYFRMQFWALISAWLATLMGIVLSFIFDAATGATIVLCQAGLFLLALLLQLRRKK